MEEIQIAKSQIREEIAQKFDALSAKEIAEKTEAIENRLFDFANFLESKITLLYINNEHEVLTENIIKRAFVYNKIVVLPAYNAENFEMELKKSIILKKIWSRVRVIYCSRTRPAVRMFRSKKLTLPLFRQWPWMKKVAESVPGKGIMTGSYPGSPSLPVRLPLPLKRKLSHRSPSNLTTDMSISSSPKIV